MSDNLAAMIARADNLEAEYFTEDQVAKLLGYKSVVTLRCIRSRALEGEHPPVHKIGRKIRYPKAGFVEWVEAQNPTSKTG